MTDDSLTFADGVLAGHKSVKGFRVFSVDGGAGKVAWASYAPGESYLVVTLGRLSRKHHVVPAGVVTSTSDRDVHVGLTRAQVKQLPDLPHPQAPVMESESYEQMMNAFGRAYAQAMLTRGGP